MKINYINIQGAILYGVSPKKLEKIEKRVNKNFEDLEITSICSTYQDGRNAIAAIHNKEIIGWIDFENNQETQQIHTINILPSYLNQGIAEDLINQAICELKNEKPTIYIPSRLLEHFTTSIEKYGWEYTSYTICSKEGDVLGYNEYTKENELGFQRKKQINY